MDIKAYYHEVSGGGYGNDEPRIKIVANLVEDDSLNILDVGCYDGTISQNYKKNTNVVTGIDIHKESLKKASELLHEVYLIDLDYDWKPLKSNTYDIVIMSAVLEHVFDYKNVFSETRRILKNNGVFINAVPNVASIRGRIELLMGKVPAWYTNFEHIRLWTSSWLNDQVSAYGFREEKFLGCFIRNKKSFTLFSRIFPSLSPIIISKFRLTK